MPASVISTFVYLYLIAWSILDYYVRSGSSKDERSIPDLSTTAQGSIRRSLLPRSVKEAFPTMSESNISLY
ncbi:hypothetical protein BDV59DRAFT_189953 [Aspergillus ambiguus]|uniref:uncharacterized protein n=1 Tax=Aspergillus ambiguus TaxID=176160 RepID=UPI003CCDE14B